MKIIDILKLEKQTISKEINGPHESYYIFTSDKSKDIIEMRLDVKNKIMSIFKNESEISRKSFDTILNQ